MSWQPPPAPPPGGPSGYPSPYSRAGVPWGPAPGLEFGGFGRRLGGYLIDFVVVGIVPAIVVFEVVAGKAFSDYLNAAQKATQTGGPTPQLNIPYTYYLVAAVVSVVLGILYWGALVGVWGRTLGQAAVGLRVVRAEDPTKRLPFDRAMLRALPWWGGGVLEVVGIVALSALAGIVFLVALLWVAWDPRKQGLHDKIASALVVRRAPSFAAFPAPGNPPPPPPPGTWAG
jgi:uncharacterized RDD family membrane protein YckC